MARKSWLKCKCGAKVHAKRGERACFKCIQKEHKDNRVG